MTSKDVQIKKRIKLLLGFVFVIFIALAVRLFYIQVLDGPRLTEMAARQQTRKSSVHAQRGKFIDSNGTVLAQSGTSYRVNVNPQSITGADAESERVRVSLLVSDILGMSYDAVYSKVSRTEKKQLSLKRQISSETVDRLEALQLGSVISTETDYTRYYTNGTLFAQLIGFCGVDGEGQTGLEALLDEYLAGADGKIVVSRDARGNTLAYGDEEYFPPTNGYDVTLTVDANAQRYLENALAQCMNTVNAETVTGLVIDPQTGAVIASASNPTFDLNAPDRSDVTSLMAMSRNRVVTDVYDCGTLFGIITVAAGLDSGVITPDTTFDCTGSMTFRTETVSCMKRSGHGTLTVSQVLEQGCTYALAEIALKMGTDTFYRYIYDFGFGTETNSGFPNETSGKVTHRKYIRDNTLAQTGYGKGITATPMQMARALSAVINGGIIVHPYVVSTITDSDGNIIKQNVPEQQKRVISSQTSAQMRQILTNVVVNGEGNVSQMANFTSGGKGGISNKYDVYGTALTTQVVASFMGFAPSEQPELMCLIYANEPRVPVLYSKYVNGPYVKRILNDILQYESSLPDNARETKQMPDVQGQTVRQAVYILERQGFPSPVYLDSEKDATVTIQTPAAGEEIPLTQRAILYTTLTTFNADSMPTTLVKVPKFIGLRRMDAYDAAEKANLVLVYDTTACLGKVITQSIDANTYVEPDTEVYLTFDKAPPSKSPAPTEDIEGDQGAVVPATQE